MSHVCIKKYQNEYIIDTLSYKLNRREGKTEAIVKFFDEGENALNVWLFMAVVEVIEKWNVIVNN